MSIPSPYSPKTKHTVPARSGVAVPLSRSQRLTVINTHGTQVIDFWAFQTPSEPPPPQAEAPTPLAIYLSMSHTRASTLHLTPLENDVLVTNERTPMLRFISDTSGLVHDTLIAACDIHRYRQLGVPEGTYHANCSDNLRLALKRDIPAYALPPTCVAVPDPLNLFMNVPVVPSANEASSTAGASLSWAQPVSPKGGKVVFEALVDCIAVMSACPQDLIKAVNTGEPTEAHFIVDE